MIDLVVTVAEFLERLEPLSVPLMVLNAVGLWRLDRRLVALEARKGE